MDYNKILRDANATLPEKEKAFSYFFTTYHEKGLRFIRTKLKENVSQLSGKNATAEDLYQDAVCILLEKIKRGVLCRPEYTAEAWLNGIIYVPDGRGGLIANLARKNTARPPKNDNYAENEENEPKLPRVIDFDDVELKVFGPHNNIDKATDLQHLREQLDIFIKKGSKTCQQLFNEFLSDGDLFDWWKIYRAADKNLDDPEILKNVRNAFDVTFSTCRKNIRDLAPLLRALLYKD